MYAFADQRTRGFAAARGPTSMTRYVNLVAHIAPMRVGNSLRCASRNGVLSRSVFILPVPNLVTFKTRHDSPRERASNDILPQITLPPAVGRIGPRRGLSLLRRLFMNLGI